MMAIITKCFIIAITIIIVNISKTNTQIVCSPCPSIHPSTSISIHPSLVQSTISPYLIHPYHIHTIYLSLSIPYYKYYI
ncbi:hypothetical protein BC829DRAFT_389728 [Chytridium lagenaria]|nr:hypothetical protein BC829DRAFT_389728 [Chytridium lagenaria]